MRIDESRVPPEPDNHIHTVEVSDHYIRCVPYCRNRVRPHLNEHRAPDVNPNR